MTKLFNYFEIFHEIDKTDRLAIDQIAREITIKKNELLKQVGQTCKTFF